MHITKVRARQEFEAQGVANCTVYLKSFQTLLKSVKKLDKS